MLNSLLHTVSYPIIAFALVLSHMIATPFLPFSTWPDIYPFQLKCPWRLVLSILFHSVAWVLFPFVSSLSVWCSSFHFACCIHSMYQSSSSDYISDYSLIRPASEHPFGSSPGGSQLPLSLFPSSCRVGSLTICDYRFVCIDLNHSGFLGTWTGVVCHCLPLVLPAVPVRPPLI